MEGGRNSLNICVPSLSAAGSDPITARASAVPVQAALLGVVCPTSWNQGNALEDQVNPSLPRYRSQDPPLTGLLNSLPADSWGHPSQAELPQFPSTACPLA